MIKLCALEKGVCPKCKKKLNNDICADCHAEIRVININLIKNPLFNKEIAKYDLEGNIVEVYKNVYECYPIDSKIEQKKRTRVIDVCKGKSKKFNEFQWRFVDDISEVGSINKYAASKEIIQIDFEGNVIALFQTIGEAKEKLKYTCSTITKACKTFFPPQGADFFLFFKDDYCEHVFEEAHIKYLESQKKIEVRDADGEIIGSFDSYEEVAERLGVSATSVSNWCRGIYKPSGKFENYMFTVQNIRKKNEKKIDACTKVGQEKCNISIENLQLKETCTKLTEKVRILEKEKNNLEKTCGELNLRVEGLLKRYHRRRPKIESRVKFMIPFEEFKKNKLHNLYAGVCVYVLCDSKGKRYVGQSSRGNYTRIKEHFTGETKDNVYNAYMGGVPFFVEQIVIGWEDSMPFNLDDAEAYFIDYYNSCVNGYNETRGNHQENKGRLDIDFSIDR